MTAFLLPRIGLITLLLTACTSTAAQDPTGAWRIKGVDAGKSNWVGELTLKADDGKLSGHIDWRATGGEYDGAEGREYIRAAFDPESRRLKLTGERLENAADLTLGEYSAELSADGTALDKGTGSAAGGAWTAKRVDASAEPALKPVETETGFLRKRFVRADGTETRYFVFVPRRYDGTRKTPVILFLHGGGETKGEVGGQPTEVGLGPYIRENIKTFPYLVVFPQAQTDGWAKNKDVALGALEQTEAEYKTDLRKVYLTGVSMGGIGVWNFAASEPLRWAAIVPICGASDPKQAHKFSHIPCWAFHGANDKVVPADGTRDMIAALKKAGGTPKYTEYSKLGHPCWDQAYATEELWRWLGDQRKR